MKNLILTTALIILNLVSFGGSVVTDPLIIQGLVQNGILNAEYIFEGEVIETKSFWNPSHNYIYTTNTVKVSQVWQNINGEVLQFEENQIVEVITYGGRVDETGLSISHNIDFLKGQKGMFLCKNTTTPTDPLSPISSNFQFELFDGIFWLYDNSEHYISASYSSINFECVEQLYELIDSNYVAECLSVYPNGALQSVKYGEYLNMANNSISYTTSGYGKVTYTFENARTTNTNGVAKFEFDIFIESNNNYYFDQGMVRIQYNNLAFGSNPINNITVQRGDILYGRPDYVNPVVGQITNTEIAIGTIAYPNAQNRTFLPAGVPLGVFHVKMEIIDCQELPQLSFINHNLMWQNSKYCLQANSTTIKSYINRDFTDTENSSMCNMSIYNNISPLQVNAGNADISGSVANPTTINGDIVTVSGIFFGNNGTIHMKNTDHGTNSSQWLKLDSYDIVSWSDNEIIFRVPSTIPINYTATNQLRVPGSGQIKITNTTTGDVEVSSQTLTVNYSRRNISRSNQNTKQKLHLSGPDLVFDEDGVNLNPGYSFIVHPNLLSTNGAISCINMALNNWVCATEVRFQIDSVNTALGDVLDSNSIIKYGTTTNPLALAQTSTWNYSCTDANGFPVDYVTDLDIVINNNPTYTNVTFYDETGTQDLPANFYDFYSIILHEFGHAITLMHVNQPTDIMWAEAHSSTSNTSYWQRHIYFSTGNQDGGIEVVTESSQVNFSSMNCYYSVYPIVSLPKSNCVVPTSIETIKSEYNRFSINSFPNPMNESAQINFTLNKVSNVILEIYSISGVLIHKIESSEYPMGSNVIFWKPNNLNSGAYVGVLKVNGLENPFRIIKL